MATTITTKTYTHIMHFHNNDEMGYAFTHLDCFINPIDASEDEFDGDAPFEVVFTTAKPISKAAITRMVKHFEPKDHKFNEGE